MVLVHEKQVMHICDGRVVGVYILDFIFISNMNLYYCPLHSWTTSCQPRRWVKYHSFACWRYLHYGPDFKGAHIQHSDHVENKELYM